MYNLIAYIMHFMQLLVFNRYSAPPPPPPPHPNTYNVNVIWICPQAPLASGSVAVATS